MLVSKKLVGGSFVHLNVRIVPSVLENQASTKSVAHISILKKILDNPFTFSLNYRTKLYISRFCGVIMHKTIITAVLHV